MLIKFGNVSPKEFAERVGSEFTADEMVHLEAVWSRNAELQSAEDFHIFDDPAISIHIGAADSRTVEVFKAANERRTFGCPVMFYLDNAREVRS